MLPVRLEGVFQLVEEYSHVVAADDRLFVSNVAPLVTGPGLRTARLADEIHRALIQDENTHRADLVLAVARGESWIGARAPGQDQNPSGQEDDQTRGSTKHARSRSKRVAKAEAARQVQQT